MTPSKCAVIIPHYNQVKDLKVCLNTLKLRFDPSQLEVIIVDNQSQDPNYQALKLEFPEFRFITESTKKNPYTCRNTGIDSSHSEYIALLDAKCIVDEEWLARVLIRIESGRPIYVGRYRLIYQSEALKDKVYGILYLNTDRNSINDYGVTASNLIVKRSVFDKIGYFGDEHRSGNDIIWTRKALKLGFSILYCPELIVSYPSQPWDLLSEKIKKYAAGVKYHRAMSTPKLLRQFLPMKYSTYRNSLKHRELDQLRRVEKVKLWYYVWLMKIRFALAYLNAR